MTNAPLPTICASCRAKAETLCAMARGAPLIMQPCPHFGPGLAVLAVAYMRDGRIESWALEGPMPFEQMTAKLEAIERGLAAQGATQTRMTRQ